MSQDPLKAQSLKIWLAVAWLFFTSAMVLWWWSLVLSELKQSLVPVDPSRYRMLISEGVFFLIATLAGGISLIVMLIKDQQREQQVKTFFSTFSHDLKTSIARLRLQADILREKSSVAKEPMLDRLAKDINRLDLQLENSLILSQGAQALLIEENLPLSQIIESLRNEWENIDISLDKEALLKADRRAIASVFRNLIQNAVIHGSADSIRIQLSSVKDGQLQIRIKDNGQGFRGEIKKLGRSPMRMHEGSGSGIGLFLCKSLLSRQLGDIRFESAGNTGFMAEVLIPGQVTAGTSV